MTVQELIDELENFDPEADVRAVQQPSYPLIASLDGNIEQRNNGEILIHLADAYDYYGGEEFDDEDEE